MESELMLRDKSRTCKLLFQRCLQESNLDGDDWVEQKSAEFNWWTSGLNADKAGPGSLDSQLSLRPDTKEVIAEVLDNLATSLLRFMEIASSATGPSSDPLEVSPVRDHTAANEADRSPSPWSDMTDGTGHHSESSTKSNDVRPKDYLYKEQKSHIEINLEILLRIHAAIKKSGLKFRNKRADDQLKMVEDEFQREKERVGRYQALNGSNTSVGEHERFRGFLTRRVLQNGYTEGLIRYMEARVYDVEHEIHLLSVDHGPSTPYERWLSFYRTLLAIFRAYLYDPARLTPIQRRLIDANVVRRNRLMYARGVDKFQSGAQQTVPQPLANITPQRTGFHVQDPEDHMKTNLAARTSRASSVAIPESRKSFVSRVATELESNFSITATLSRSTGSPSAVTEISTRVEDLDYPKCPATEGPFPCPYCPLILSSNYTGRKKWRAHVSRDLCPYVCIFESCNTANDMYATSEEWKSHMVQFHSVEEWVCMECLKESPERLSDIADVAFQDQELLKEHIISLHPEFESSAMDARINAGRRFSGVQSMVCPLCRPGTVTSPSTICGEEDEIQWTDQAEGDHIATHIHQFSLHAIPWPDTIETGVGSKQTSRSSGTSPRQIIAYRATDDITTASNESTSLYSSHEVHETFRHASAELHYLHAETVGITDLLKRMMSLEDSVRGVILNKASFKTLDQEAFLVSVNECRILISQLGQIMLSSTGISGQDIIHAELLEHLEKLAQLLHQARNKSDSKTTDSLDGKRPSYQVRSLRSSIRSFMVESVFHKRTSSFLPEGKVDEFISRNFILRAFYRRPKDLSFDIPVQVEKIIFFILRHAKKIFSICVWMNIKGAKLYGLMVFLMESRITDNQLPFDETKITDFYPAMQPEEDAKSMYPGQEAPTWDEDDIDDFIDSQPQFCAPIFFTDRKIHDIDSEAILPFIEKDVESAREGSFGQVMKFRIHESHLVTMGLVIPCTNYVAVKRIKREAAQEQRVKNLNWEKEVAALWKMRVLRETHIVNFITAFRLGHDEHYLIFEWADGGNLRSFWETFAQPLTPGLVKDVLGQLSGLARALDQVHNPKSENSGQHFRHGDLKPENILWFKDRHDSTSIGTLKIGDWGLTKQHNESTELRTIQTSTGFGTRRYEPPEEQTTSGNNLIVSDDTGRFGRKRSRLYDLWAMGCIWLEFLIWLMYGMDGLKRFNRAFNQGRTESCSYYEIDGNGEAKVHRVALQWMEHMAQDPVCQVGQTALGDLLEFIRDRLLVVKLPQNLGTTIAFSQIIHPSGANRSLHSEKDCRARAKDLCNRMEDIMTDVDDASYWLPGTPLSPPVPAPEDVGGHQPRILPTELSAL